MSYLELESLGARHDVLDAEGRLEQDRPIEPHDVAAAAPGFEDLHHRRRERRHQHTVHVVGAERVGRLRVES